METSNSEHIKEETPEGQKDEQEKERIIQELDGQIAELKEQLNAVFDETNRLLTQQSEEEVELFTHEQVVEEPGSVHKTEKEEIEQLTKQLNKANITINKLQSVNKRLREGKDAAELAKAKLEEEAKELRQTIYQLERALERERKSLQDLEEKGHLCKNDCGLCCLLWICNNKQHLYPCGSHLRTIITLEADRSDPIIENKYLRCEAFMSILVKHKVVYIYPKQLPKRPEMDDIHDRYCNKDKTWEKLMGVDTKERAVIIGSLILSLNADEVGHCVVCDLETDSREKGLLTIHDPQTGKKREVKRNAFEENIKYYDGVVLFTVNFTKLKRIIKAHEKSLMHEESKDCETNLTATDNNRMDPVLPTVTESPEEPKIIELPAESTDTKLPAESTVTELPVEPNIQPATQDMFPEEP